MRVLAALALGAGVATELAVLHDYPRELRWLTPTLILAGALAAALLLLGGARLRRAALAAALALLLLAPATWAIETLGHATSSTFPAGGPADNPAGGFGGAGRPGGAGRAGGLGSRSFAGGRPGGLAGRPGAGPPEAGAAQGAPTGGAPALFGNGERAGLRFGAGAGRPAGAAGAAGPGDATSESLVKAVRYAKTHGGGTVAVASQSEAAPLVIDGDDVAGIGGFSGRESETNAAWLAQEVRAGHIRWVLTTSSGPGGGLAGGVPSLGGGLGFAGGAPGQAGATGMGRTPGLPTGAGAGPRGGTPGGRAGGHEERVGANHALAAVEKSCKRVGAVSGLYDCAGRAAQLAAA